MPPAERQLRLFPPPRPLHERFGAEFFRKIPEAPGVYLMYDAAGKLIYVGQSKNLRQRLNSYRYAAPETHPRKLIRLIHAAAEIHFEICDDAHAARLRENFLLRTHRPKFNTAQTYPKAYAFISLEASPDGVRLRLGTELPRSGEIFGAFKSRAFAAFASLCRLLFITARRPASPAELPAGFYGRRSPRIAEFPSWDSSAPGSPHPPPADLIRQFLLGTSNDLVVRLEETVANRHNLGPFYQDLITLDLEELTAFFERGPARNARLREVHGLKRTWIGQEELDDLLILRAAENSPS